ncbi:unnamed protein product [Symbiodinium natans]|uniref:BTB domain-containing protein n=1 Tax=Symbiodinium natans TaxID=878477 RepID=A0A812UI71_9DINO|nr:unnamed protein product [Symbiodinium natans]
MAPGDLDGVQLDACEYLAQRLRQLRAEGKYCDVVLVAGGARIAAHRAVLATASTAWQQALHTGGSSDDVEALPSAELRFPRCARPEVLQLLIDHIYADITLDQAIGQIQGKRCCRDVMRLFQALGPAASPELPSLRLARRLSQLRGQGIFCDTVRRLGVRC